jgi:hypothetical protein
MPGSRVFIPLDATIGGDFWEEKNEDSMPLIKPF